MQCVGRPRLLLSVHRRTSHVGVTKVAEAIL